VVDARILKLGMLPYIMRIFWFEEKTPPKNAEAPIAQQVPLRLPSPIVGNAFAQMAFQSGLAIQAECRAARTSPRSTSAGSPLAFMACCGWALRGRRATHYAPILAFQACSSKPLRNGTTLGEMALEKWPFGPGNWKYFLGAAKRNELKI
jgi:hypothetical protein